MKKLKLQMKMSIDGSPQLGLNDDQHWVTWAWDEIKHHVIDLASSCDTELIGRKLAVDYIPFWSQVLSQPESPFYEAARIKANQKKIVFTKTMEKSPWDNTELAKGDLVEEVTRLKEQGGQDIIVYGGTSFVSALIEEGLIDEFYLFLNPVALGKNGVPLFDKLTAYQPLKLKKSTAFDCGIVLLNYEL